MYFTSKIDPRNKLKKIDWPFFCLIEEIIYFKTFKKFTTKSANKITKSALSWLKIDIFVKTFFPVNLLIFLFKMWERSIFCQLLNINMFKGTLEIRVFIDITREMYKNNNCLIIFTNIDNLLIFKFRNSRIALKDNFVNNWKKANARKFLNFYALKYFANYSLIVTIFFWKGKRNNLETTPFLTNLGLMYKILRLKCFL